MTEDTIVPDIVDAQVHIGPGGIEHCLAAMDALGIRSVLVDEYWMSSGNGDPGYLLPNGVFRPLQPTAELAAMLHPSRFSYLVRVDRRDSELEAIVRMAGEAPYARAVRVTPGISQLEASAFAQGEYDAVCAACLAAALPLFVFAPGQAQAIGRYASKFPDLRIVIDHCGLTSPAMARATGRDSSVQDPAQWQRSFDDILALSAFPNVAFKWAHAPAMFESPGYPSDALGPYLRRVLDAFGAQRVMWASDVTANQTGESWAELLFGLRGLAGVSPSEKQALLGATARTWLDWKVGSDTT
ncbi:amidohydrolase family protein [Mangrovimicrobium sediminis]|nr:amidohydrolase family protein [Haliea sp. SAOS-164]